MSPLEAEILTGLVPRLIQKRKESQKLRALGEKMNPLYTPEN